VLHLKVLVKLQQKYICKVIYQLTKLEETSKVFENFPFILIQKLKKNSKIPNFKSKIKKSK